MHTVLSILGILASLTILKYREQVGNMIGEAEWMKKVGGVYMFIVILSVFFFFWSVAELTGTTYIFVRPFTILIPGFNQQTQLSPPPAAF